MFGTTLLALMAGIEMLLQETNTMSYQLTEEVAYVSEWEEEYVYHFTEEEEWLMVRVAMLEGGNQGIEGIAMIYRVILNRLESPKWPDTIREVIFQPNQFTVANRVQYANPNEDCYEALELVKRGWDESNGVMHFWGDGKKNHFY